MAAQKMAKMRAPLIRTVRKRTLRTARLVRRLNGKGV